MSHFHAVVWLDHSDAHVFHFTPDEVEKLTAESTHPHPRQHSRRGNEGAAGKAGEDRPYFDRIVKQLLGAQEVLVVGPGNAKLGFIKHVHRHAQDLEKKIIGVETVDHPTDRQLVAYARKYFAAHDRMIS